MKKLIVILTCFAFTVALQAGTETSPAAKSKSTGCSGCAMAGQKTKAEAKTKSCCPGKQAKQTLASPKAGSK